MSDREELTPAEALVRVRMGDTSGFTDDDRRAATSALCVDNARMFREGGAPQTWPGWPNLPEDHQAILDDHYRNWCANPEGYCAGLMYSPSQFPDGPPLSYMFSYRDIPPGPAP